MPTRRQVLQARGFLASYRPQRGAQRKATRILRIWRCMRGRCLYPSHTYFDNYGGRGIRIRWASFVEFRAWVCRELRERYRGRHTEFSIDRIDTDGDYEPENCRLVPVDANRAAQFFVPQAWQQNGR